MSGNEPYYVLIRVKGKDVDGSPEYSASTVAVCGFDNSNTAYEKLLTYEIGTEVEDEDGDVWERVS